MDLVPLTNQKVWMNRGFWFGTTCNNFGLLGIRSQSLKQYAKKKAKMFQQFSRSSLIFKNPWLKICAQNGHSRSTHGEKRKSNKCRLLEFQAGKALNNKIKSFYPGSISKAWNGRQCTKVLFWQNSLKKALLFVLQI